MGYCKNVFIVAGVLRPFRPILVHASDLSKTARAGFAILFLFIRIVRNT